MTAEVFITLQCDYRITCFEFIETGQNSTTNARHQAKSEGWQYVGKGKDLCPKHSSARSVK